MKEYSESKVTGSSYSMLPLVTQRNFLCRYHFSTDVLSFRQAEDT